MINDPGYVLGPNGRLATDEDGEPVQNKPLVNESLRTLVLIAEKRSRLFGADKPTRTHVTVDVAEQQKNAALAAITAKIAERDREMESLRRRAAVIPGEVLAELPPGVT